MTMKPDHERMIERIYSELVGDEYTEGIISKVNRNAERLEKHEGYFKIILGLAAVMSGIAIFFESIKNLFK